MINVIVRFIILGYSNKWYFYLLNLITFNLSLGKQQILSKSTFDSTICSVSLLDQSILF